MLMRKIQQLGFCLLTALGIVTSCYAKDWRGIVPMRSTKDDVVRILGAPAAADKTRAAYNLDKEDVLIIFSGVAFCDSKTTGMAKGTVLLIQVTPREITHVDTLQLNKKNLKEFRPSAEDPTWKGLIDEHDGLMVRSFKDRIHAIFYLPTSADRGRCPDYYDDIEASARIVMESAPRVFDQYSDLDFSDEKARLDNFGIHLTREPGLKAYLVGYPIKNKEADIWFRMERAKRHLMELGIAEKRISIVIGSSGKDLLFELYALPPDVSPPILERQ
jgi:hypothetical protein